jgi:hypothetical protein
MLGEEPMLEAWEVAAQRRKQQQEEQVQAALAYILGSSSQQQQGQQQRQEKEKEQAVLLGQPEAWETRAEAAAEAEAEAEARAKSEAERARAALQRSSMQSQANTTTTTTTNNNNNGGITRAVGNFAAFDEDEEGLPGGPRERWENLLATPLPAQPLQPRPSRLPLSSSSSRLSGPVLSPSKAASLSAAGTGTAGLRLERQSNGQGQLDHSAGTPVPRFPIAAGAGASAGGGTGAGAGAGASMGFSKGATLSSPLPSSSVLGSATSAGAASRGEDSKRRLAQAQASPQDALGVDAQGRPQYSYDELVRRNLLKGALLDFSCEGEGERDCASASTELSIGNASAVRVFNQANLEQFLDEKEFLHRFGMTKESFSMVPKWRQAEIKKALQLF